MVYNYLKTAFRFVTKNISFTIINLLGLTAGITAFLLIAMYLQDQLSYDHQIPDQDRLFRLIGIQEPDGLDKQHVAITSAPWVPYLLENIPQVEDGFRVMGSTSIIVEVEDQVFNESSIYFSERNVVELMGYRILHGANPETMLSEPNQAVISREVAQRFFDSDNAVGKIFKNGDHTYLVTGVFENENINTHLKLNILLSFATVENEIPWLQNFNNNTLATYLKLRNGAEAVKVEELINQKQQSLMEEETSWRMMPITFYLQNMGDIFLRSGHIKFHMRSNEGSISNVYIFALVAFFILAIACINYINLATANSAKRAKEVGLRKVLGASRQKLAFQFIGESLFITFFSIIVSLGVIELLLPDYNALLNTNLNINFTHNYLFNIGLIGILLFVGMISGLYPAVYISRFQPILVLRAGDETGKPRTAWLRKILVIVQFAISTGMILATAVVMHQVNHMKKKDLGYNTENVISIPIRQTSDYDQIRGFQERLLQFPEVKSAGIASNYNGVAGRQSTITVADSLNTRLMVRYGYVDPGYFPTMEMRFIKGRNFSHEYGTDPNQTIIINRATQSALGWDDPIGKQFVNNDHPDYETFTVIGVIEDYHFYSLHNPIEPAVYIWRPGDMRVITVRYQTHDSQALMGRIENEFKSYFPGYYFQASYVSDLLARLYKSESNTMKIFTWFSLLCIVISCLGLFGLTSFMVNQRRKEISIRKVMGGSIFQINALLLSSFMKWVLLAGIIAIPITWLAMQRWLANFAYHIQVSWPHISLSLVLVSVIASVTILVLSTRAAMQNPASAIKYE
jgi:putative ABC transport system permease protein